MPPRKRKQSGGRRTPENPVHCPDLAQRLESLLSTRRQWLILACLLAFMAALRLLYIIEFHGHSLESGDTKFFLALARQIGAGDLFLRDQSLIFSPFYYYFLGGLFALFGESITLVLSVQCLLGMTGGLLVYLLARDLFGSLTAMFSMTLYALYGMILFYEGQVLDASFSVLLPSLFLLLLHRASLSGRLLLWFAAGISLGMFALTRPNVLVFFPLAAGWAFMTRRAERNRARRIAAVLTLAGGIILTILPFTVRNWVYTGEPVLITAHGGINFYVGNNEQATGFFTPPAGMPPLPGIFNLEIPRAIAERESGTSGMSDSEVSDYWFAKGVTFLRSQPGRFIHLTLKKTKAFFNGYEVPINLDFYFLKSLSTALRLAPLTLGVVMPLGLAGMIFSLWRRPHSLLLLYFFSYAVSVILFFITARYRLPVVPVLIIYAGFGIRCILAVLQTPGRLALHLACVIPLILLTNVDLGIHFDPAIIAHSRGYTMERLGKAREAAAYYEDALRHNPQLVLSHIHLARLRAREGLLDRAAFHYQSALRYAPADQALRQEAAGFAEHLRRIEASEDNKASEDNNMNNRAAPQVGPVDTGRTRSSTGTTGGRMP